MCYSILRRLTTPFPPPPLLRALLLSLVAPPLLQVVITSAHSMSSFFASIKLSVPCVPAYLPSCHPPCPATLPTPPLPNLLLPLVRPYLYNSSAQLPPFSLVLFIALAHHYFAPCCICRCTRPLPLLSPRYKSIVHNCPFLPYI